MEVGKRRENNPTSLLLGKEDLIKKSAIALHLIRANTAVNKFLIDSKPDVSTENYLLGSKMLIVSYRKKILFCNCA